MVKEIHLGCRSRTYSFNEIKNDYDDNRRSIIPETIYKYVIAVNEAGEQIVIAVPKWDVELL